MARENTLRDGSALFRAALLAALCLPWFTACPPAGPRLIPPPAEPEAAEIPSTPEVKPPAETPLPAPAEEKEAAPDVSAPADYESVHSLTVPGHAAWTDTGLLVEEGQGLVIQAEGAISLQKGNPTAICGPGGYKLKTVQQPLPDQNIGALIGKVVLVLSVSTDPQTGKEVRDELVEVFPLGGRAEVKVPLRGRLYLGVNELVVGDNEGAYSVKLYLLR